MPKINAENSITNLRSQLDSENGPKLLRDLNLLLSGLPTEPTFQFDGDIEEGELNLQVQRGIIYVRLPSSKGLEGSQWIRRFGQTKAGWLTPDARKFLASDEFSPTPAGFVHTLAIVPHRYFSPEGHFGHSEVESERHIRNWKNPHPEVACMIAESLSGGCQWLRDMKLDSLDFYCDEGYLYLQDRRNSTEPYGKMVLIGSQDQSPDHHGGEMGIGDGFVWEV